MWMSHCSSHKHINTPTLFPFTCCSYWLCVRVLCDFNDGQACNEPSGRGVVTVRYCDWSDGQIKAANKTLLAPHTVTMYRLWDARWYTFHTLCRCWETEGQTDIMKHVFKECLATKPHFKKNRESLTLLTMWLKYSSFSAPTVFRWQC